MKHTLTLDMLAISGQCEPRFQTTVSGYIVLFCCISLVGPFKSSEAQGGSVTNDNVARSCERSRRYKATNSISAVLDFKRKRMKV